MQINKKKESIERKKESKKMNPALLKLIQTGADITKEVMVYANETQKQINDLNKDQIDGHNRKINNLQKEHDIIVEMAMNKNATYEEKMKLVEKMEELQKAINDVIDEKNALEAQEKEAVKEEKRKVGQVALEVATGIIPFTTAYRALKKRTKAKRIDAPKTEYIDAKVDKD